MKKLLFAYLTCIFIFCICCNKTVASYTDDFKQIQTESENCMAQTSNTLIATQCSIKEQKAWEKEIDKLLVEHKRVLKPEDYRQLVKAQRIWEKYKNESFKIFNKIPSYKSATMFQNIQQGCKTGLVKQHALDLYEYLQYYKEN